MEGESKSNSDIDDFFFCDLCRYKFKKERILEKHKNMKHVITQKYFSVINVDLNSTP